MDVVVLRQAEKEIKQLPGSVIKNLYFVLRLLEQGEKLSMPLSRPLPNIANGLNELRFCSNLGNYRVFYVVEIGEAIFVVHACSKKTQKISNKTLRLLKIRIKNLESL